MLGRLNPVREFILCSVLFEWGLLFGVVFDDARNQGVLFGDFDLLF